MAKWSIDDSIELYNIKGWGDDYFDINSQGNIIVKNTSSDEHLDLCKLIQEMDQDDVSTPILVRIPHILGDRIKKISNCFENASKEYNYDADHFVVYPIKVNQMKPVVDEIIDRGKDFNIGLEAGSKPELHAVLASALDNDSPIICNGYKDSDFIELALLAKKMGKNVIIVVEKLNELKLIIEIAQKLSVQPNIGIRIKLASSGSGKWEDSGGDKSKFGLNASELLEAINIISEYNMLDNFNLIHFHLGSQITKIRSIKTALREVAQYYIELKKLGCNIKNVDIGGGLGVDYDGTKSSSASSINYTIQEYVNDAIFSITDASNKNDIKHPNIIIESGRAVTAHHSILIFDVLEKASLPSLQQDFELPEDAHELVIELDNILSNLSKNRLLEPWHDTMQIRQEAMDLFSLGHLTLRARALVETFYWEIARKINKLAQTLKHPPLEFAELPKLLADKYFCNFSLFQSLPDSWAIDHMFPIIPISRLNEEPKIMATLQDITCDSDGKIDSFIGYGDLSNILPVHQIQNKEKYYLGVFLVGAYQEILGDLHNLFGDTNVVHVSLRGDSFVIDQVIDGETVEDVLEYVGFEPKKMVRKIESWVNRSIKKNKITAQEGKEFLSNYKSGLYGYTYLE